MYLMHILNLKGFNSSKKPYVHIHDDKNVCINRSLLKKMCQSTCKICVHGTYV